MGKGKKSKKSFLASLEESAADASQDGQKEEGAKLSRKERREQKLAKKAANNAEPPTPPEKDEPKEEEEEVVDDVEDEEEEDSEPKTSTTSAFAGLSIDDSDDDNDDDEGDDDDDDESTSKKSKKSKKEKKSKKDKSKKKKKKDNDDDDDEDADDKKSKKEVYYGEADEYVEGPKIIEGLMDANGKKKKLSNKERRKLQAENEAALAEIKYNALASKKTEFAVSATTGVGGEAWDNATDINIPSFSISAYGKTLFHNAELKITAGRRYGLVGPNGMGKTTILKQLANGELKIPPKIDCLYVEQEVTADDTPAVEMVLQADTKRTALLERENEIMSILDSDKVDTMSMDEQESLHTELKKVSDELRAMGSDGAESRALSLLNGLGFTEEMQRAPTKSFSGGWRMRVSLARALFMAPTLMLLDEPTNHLDLNAVIWLDDYLQKWKNTLLIVSHDQDFLDSVCTDVIHLDQQRLFYYRGNYSQFKDQYQITRAKLVKDYEKQEKELKALKKKGKTIEKAKEQMAARNKREGGGARKKKNEVADTTQNAGAGLADRQLIQRPKEYTVNFSFPPVDQLSPPIIQIDNVAFGYPDRKPLFKKLNFGIDLDSRITIVGANGIGKSTLLKVITQELVPTAGEVKINRRLRIARYHQHFLDILPMGLSPVEFLREKHTEVTYQEARNRLGRFGLEGHAHTIKMLNLSGGQKSRVVFASLSFESPHILIFDEPTNNLDLESIDALCEAINEFDGGVVLVSHDARLITATDCRLWVLDRKKITELPGGFDEYKDSLLEQLRKTEEEQKAKQEAKQAASIAEREKKLKILADRRAAKLKSANKSK